MEIGAVIAAAGLSSRMGDFKPMLNIGSISISQRIVATLKQAGVGRIAVVTGYNADALERHLAQSGVVFLRNENYRATHMFDSARIGLEYMSGKCQKLLFTPVDVPLFTAATVEALISSGCELACPVCGGERGHPILMSSAVAKKLISDGGEGGLQGAIGRCGTAETLVSVDDPGILRDADTPEDYKALLDYHNSQLVRPVAQVSLAREKPFFDDRVAMLLSLVGETGSVRKACQRMQLSYSSGWNTIKAVEEQLGRQVVRRRQGGASGGHSELTWDGRELLRLYQLFENDVRDAVGALYEKYFSGIL